MRNDPVPPLVVAWIAALAALAGLASVAAAPAAATPSKNSACASCHSGTASGTVTAVPSTATPAPGATYTVAIDIGLTASGKTGYHMAQTDVAGLATTWMAVYGGTGSQSAWTATMTAPATPGTYYYKAWTAKGYSGMAKAVTYSITVPAPAPAPAITSLTPTHAQTGASVVIAGSDLGASGVVKFGATTATTSAWSATQVTATVPASLAPGATSVTVQPAGAAVSNALAFTVDAPPVPVDTTDPVTTASGVPGLAWCNYPVTVSLAATDEAAGSGVKSIAYAVDGGDPVFVEGAGASVLLETSGTHTVAFFAKDVAGNVEATRSVTVNLDLSKPHPQAPRSATVRHARTATLRYRIVDATPNAGTATVTIAVKNSRGKTVLRLELGSRPVNTALKATFTCRLRPGEYRFRVSATDAAGNPQAAVASQRLHVLAR